MSWFEAMQCGGVCPFCWQRFYGGTGVGHAFRRASLLWSHIKESHPEEQADESE